MSTSDGRGRRRASCAASSRPEDSEGLKVGVFVDGMDRIHGVATMYRSVQALVGEERTELLRIVCCGGEDNPSEEGVHTLRKVATFTGFLRGEALARLYVSCDVFVFPSTTDTLGRAVAEAQASGLPSVVCGIGGPRECIRPGVSGFVADPGDEEVFFTKIELLLEDPRLRDGWDAWPKSSPRAWPARAGGNPGRPSRHGADADRGGAGLSCGWSVT